MAFNIWDVKPDTPINNFATLDPLFKDGIDSTQRLFEGNLKFVGTHSASSDSITGSTFNMPTSGLWYFELYSETMTNNYGEFGFGDVQLNNFQKRLSDGYDDSWLGDEGYSSDNLYIRPSSDDIRRGSHNSGSSVYTAIGWGASKIAGMLVDCDKEEVTFYINNTIVGGSIPKPFISNGNHKFIVSYWNSANNTIYHLNFGQDPTFNGSKTPTKVYTDSNGQGRFFYEPPAGALALCTRNLATPKNVPAEYIVDETNQHLLTYNGNTQVSKFSPYATDGWSIHLNGSNQRFYLDKDAFLYSTGDFSFECFVYLRAGDLSNYQVILDTRSGGAAEPLVVGLTSNNTFYFYTSSEVLSSGKVLPNKWTHLLVARQSGTLKMFLDGNQVYSASNSSNFSPTNTTTGYIGSAIQSVGWCQGYITEIRSVVGSSAYDISGNTIQVPTSYITSTGPNTKLLISANSKQFVDSSTNSYSITLEGSPEISDWSPYTSVNKQTGYELVTTENGGSFKFDGNSQQVKFATSADFELTGDATVEMWVYLNSAVTGNTPLYGYGNDAGSNYFSLHFAADGKLQWYQHGSLSGIESTASVRIRQWHHIALVIDGNTLKVYNNGVEVISSSYSASFPTGHALRIGSWYNTTNYGSNGHLNGYIADYRVVNGTAVTPSTGGPTSKLSSIANTKLLLQPFQPKDTINSSFFNVTDNYAQDETGKALTYAGNVAVSASSPYKSGDYGSFSFGGQNSGDYIDLGNLGTDVVNLTGSYTFEGWVYVIGNTSAGGIITSYDDAASGWRIIFRSNSKIVFEYFGVTDFLQLENTTSILNKWTHFVVVSNGTNVAGYIDGVKKATASHTTINGASTGGYTGQLMIGTNALDQASTWNMDGKIADLHFINGTAKYNPSDTTISVPYEPVTVDVNNSVLLAQPGKVADSENVTAKDPDAYMKAVTYTGDHPNTKSVNVEFNPDLIWLKSRTQTYGHGLWDTIRTVNGYEQLSPNTNAAQATSGDEISFITNGFRVDTGQAYNETGQGNDNMVAWCWKAGGAPSGLNIYMKDDVGYQTLNAAGINAGTITPTAMSVNTKAGFSIVSYTGPGNGISGTLPHGLGKEPKFVITKSLNNTYNWMVYHKSAGVTHYTELNSANPFANDSLTYNGPHDSNVVKYGGTTVVAVGNFIAYIWAEIPGFSAFGSYTGNGSATDGPFVYTGFKPAWVMVKGTTTNNAHAWKIWNNASDTYNLAKKPLWANLINSEPTGLTIGLDFLSNGFKIRSDDVVENASYNYIYAAFAETPVPYATAR